MKIDFVVRFSPVETWYDCVHIPKIEDIVKLDDGYYQVHRITWVSKDQILCGVMETEQTRWMK